MECCRGISSRSQRVPPGDDDTGVGVGEVLAGSCCLNLGSQREPLETEIGVRNSEGEQRKWTRVRMGRRT